MASEAASAISDLEPQAQLIECQPEPTLLAVNVSCPPDGSPVQQAMTATIEQTGADPPPEGDR